MTDRRPSFDAALLRVAEDYPPEEWLEAALALAFVAASEADMPPHEFVNRLSDEAAHYVVAMDATPLDADKDASARINVATGAILSCLGEYPLPEAITAYQTASGLAAYRLGLSKGQYGDYLQKIMKIYAPPGTVLTKPESNNIVPFAGRKRHES